MAGSWPRASIGEISLGLFDGPHATPAPSETGPVFLRIENIERTGRLDFSDIRRINDADFPRWTRRVKPQADDIVFSYEANLGLFCRIPNNFHGCLGRRLALIRPDKSKVNPAYLHYACLSPAFQELLRQRTVLGSTVDRISLKEFPSYQVPLPSLWEQEKIAGILGALDEKIELNRRMNATLEAMARALFQSWFVDFDPVRAKLDGRQPVGMDKATADLFSNAFEESSCGPIPIGWKRSKLRDIAEVLSGGTPSRKNPSLWDGDIPWISPKAMMQIHVHDSDERVSTAAIGNGTRLVSTGSILVMVRGMGLHQGVRISQAQTDVTFNQDVKAIVAKTVPSVLLLYGCLHATQSLLSKVHASGHGTGVLSTEFLDQLEFAVPPTPICDKLSQVLNELNSQIAVNTRESNTLAILRDSLLPRLLSGKLSI